MEYNEIQGKKDVELTWILTDVKTLMFAPNPSQLDVNFLCFNFLPIRLSAPFRDQLAKINLIHKKTSCIHKNLERYSD